MPREEQFWNPYRWVDVPDKAVQHETPNYHHRMSGLSGRLDCQLEALTPLLIGDGNGRFVLHKRSQRPYIPATSLKGSIRSLAELIGNASIPFGTGTADPKHTLQKARTNQGQLDITARTFGYLDGGNAFAGLIHFSDADMLGESPPRTRYQVAVGQPKSTHDAFYPNKARRKFYHHRVGATGLTKPHSGITLTSTVDPVPPGTSFIFTVHFTNLREVELNLLLYCLTLEKQCEVSLSRKALGPDAQGSKTLTGPLRHKIGGTKPHGAGSVHIQIKKMQLREDAAARYRGEEHMSTWESEPLTGELEGRTASFRQRTDPTMQQLRAMLIYAQDDPRKRVEYPTWQWFNRGNNSQKGLKPIL